MFQINVLCAKDTSVREWVYSLVCNTMTYKKIAFLRRAQVRRSGKRLRNPTVKKQVTGSDGILMLVGCQLFMYSCQRGFCEEIWGGLSRYSRQGMTVTSFFYGECREIISFCLMLIYYGIDCNIACFQNAIMKCFVENNLFTICQIFKKKVTYMGLVMM